MSTPRPDARDRGVLAAAAETRCDRRRDRRLRQRGRRSGLARDARLLADAVVSRATVVGAVPALYARPAASATRLARPRGGCSASARPPPRRAPRPGSQRDREAIDATRVARPRRPRRRQPLLRLSVSTSAQRRHPREDGARSDRLSVQPGANLYLQDRGAGSPRRRGLRRSSRRCAPASRFASAPTTSATASIPFGDADPLDECRIGVLGCAPRGPGAADGGDVRRAEQLAVGDRAECLSVPIRSRCAGAAALRPRAPQFGATSSAAAFALTVSSPAPSSERSEFRSTSASGCVR